ncbi:MAG: hypothetical protein JNN10_07840 [Sphingopyxis sp.]|uniref:formyltransferase family protein n=1 Tax=Sphingopyxis sp. TaxID=1908224 RepID=UPI001A5C38E3|nr:formyltransferase family protein [Sphingopyxis sp.]MBL9066189.1 hypothetical protein [Sphingopyxis sp.]
MRIEIICSDDRHPVRPYLDRWQCRHATAHEVAIVNTPAQLTGGDILFAISCSDILRPHHRSLFLQSLIIHASDLPCRRGWSPHIWAILEGETRITVSLLTADDPVDSGLIFHQESFHVTKADTLEQINAKLFEAEILLMDWAVVNINSAVPRQQAGEPTYCRRRTPDDSRLDPEQSIAAQFDILRLADSKRFPAFFDLHGHRYALALTRTGTAEDENR